MRTEGKEFVDEVGKETTQNYKDMLVSIPKQLASQS